MHIIRDTSLGGLAMIPLFVDWHIRRCNVKGCKAEPNTIVTGIAVGLPPVGLCEAHYQEGNRPNGTTLTFEFDGYDAFAAKEAA